MRDRAHLDELVRRTARIRDEQLLAERDRGAEDELTRQIVMLPREPVASAPSIGPVRRRGLLPALAGLATIAVAATALLLSGPSGSPPAIADWDAEPTPLTDAEWREFDAFCRGVEEPRDVDDPILSEAERLIIADKRGRTTFGLYVSPDGRLTDCHHLGAVPDSRDLGGGGPGTSDRVIEPLEGPLDVDPIRPSFHAPRNGSAEALYGRIGAEVAQVTFHLDDGRSLEASLDEGHYLGWWPTSCSGSRFELECTPDIIEVEARDREGRTLDRWSPLDEP